MIKIDFEKTDGTYTFRDAIVLPDTHTLTEQEIEDIKQQRWDNWIAIINNPVAPELDEDGNPIVPGFPLDDLPVLKV